MVRHDNVPVNLRQTVDIIKQTFNYITVADLQQRFREILS